MRILASALVAALFIPSLAFAETGRFSDGQYLRASRCAAYSQTPALKDEAQGVSWLSAELKAQRENREEFLTTKAGDEARDIARMGRKANTEAKIAALRAEQVKACAGFAMPTTSASAGAVPGA
jgi:hypothetical protein